jgi:type IV pilus assembly protein PilY1
MSNPMSLCNQAGAARQRPTSRRRAALAVVAALAAATTMTGLRATDLSSVPLPTYTVGSTTDIKPNIMMVLDDSGSMGWDYLPDWANDRPANYQSVSSGNFGDTWSNGSPHVPNLPQYLYFNANFNGVAYNPAVTYSPPVMFKSDGTKDTAAYPSMTGTSAATGRDTAVTANPNWGKVLNDGYKIQDTTGTSNLMDTRNAYFYSAVAGEFCDSPALTNCQTTAAGKFAYPAALRWCSDQQLTQCRGLQSSTYKYPRFPAPRIATLTISAVASGGGNVTGITVDGKQIMSGTASVTSSDPAGLVSAVATKINDCRYSLLTNCTIVGYFALVSPSDSKTIAIFAPGVPPSSPSIAQSTAVTSTLSNFDRAQIPVANYFSSGNRSSAVVPGENLRTVLTSSVTSYPYPGTVAKAATRTDCSGTTCTWVEEMTNYANWWAYYRTRMQMMKTATSRAFGSLDSDADNLAGVTRYRVGYLTINNNNSAKTSQDFVNIADFTPSQKVIWYSQLFNANPSNGTPLKSALSTAGQLYGGMFDGKPLRGKTVIDPLQFSCQKNYTILSTDGYWNGNDTAPNGGEGSKLDATTMVGNQDGGLARPYNDGAVQQLQTRTSPLQSRTETQVAQKGTLQKQITQIQMQTSALQQRTSALQQITANLQKATSTVQSSTSTLQTATWQLQKRTSSNGVWGAWSGTNSCSPNNRTQCQTVAVTAWTNATGTCSMSSPSNSGNFTNCQYSAWSAPAPAASCTVKTQSAGPSNFTVLSATACSYSAWSAPATVSSCTIQNQTTSTNNNTAYTATATACSYAVTPGSPQTVSSCTVTNPSSGTANGTNYTVATSSACVYSGWSGWNPVASCTKVNQSTGNTNGTVYNVATASDCGYSAYSAWSDAGSCTPVAQSTGPTNYTVQTAVNCQPVVSQAFTNAASCTPSSTPDANGRTFQCQYVFAASAATSTCAPAAVTGDFSNATVYQNCATTSNNTWTNATSCTIGSPNSSGNFTNCRYDVWGNWSNVGSCAAAAQSTGPSFTVGTARECQTVAGSGGSPDTLADVAAYYYNTDLRNASQTGADKTGTCTGPTISPATTANDLCTDNVTPFGRDVNPRQHMTTHTLGLGAQGYMVFSPYQNDLSGQRSYAPDYWTQPSGDFYDVASASTASPSTGICPWKNSGAACTWPTPSSDSPANIDDLWHAAVNGHGTYFSATDPSSLANSLTNVLNQITNTPRPGTAAAAASSNPNITSSDNYVFSSSYRSIDWYGELIMQRFNSDGTLTPQQWSAMRLLDCAMTPWQGSRNYAAGDVYKQGSDCYLVTTAYSSGGSFSTSDSNNATKLASGPVTRKIYTVGSGALINFGWSDLDATQKTYFSTPAISAGSASGGLSQFCSSGPSCLGSAQQTSASGQPLVDYLKGDRSNEGTYFRTRSHILGDIVSSEARYVKVPLQSYTDSGYSSFQTAMANRLPTVYVGGNDGMLHAFDALTGVERWGFIPTVVLPNMYHLADVAYNNNHRYFVDGTPEVGDICPKAPSGTCNSAEWKTILVGGLNQGGKTFYALDITDPNTPKYLWEFKDANMGYSYSNARISKLKDGTWVVIVASGYNNADGIGHLYVLNANSGSVISDITTTVGDTTNPSGLTRLAARAPLATTNNTVEEVYGGDLNGNVWRFDVNGDIGAAGIDAQLLVSLKDSAGNPQPVTAKPTVASVNNLPLVILGTGRYLGVADLTDTKTYSVYAIKDKLDAVTLTSPRVSNSKFVQQTMIETTCPIDAPSTTCTQGQIVRMASANAVDWADKNGWYLDFPVGGERSVTDATLALGTLVFTTIKPQSATADQIAGCNGSDTAINAKSYLYYLDYLTGGAVEGTKNVVGEELCTCIATRPSVVKTQSGNVEGIIRTSGGASSPTSGDSTGGGSTDMGQTQRQDLPYKNSGGPARRISWRELNGD